MLTPEGLWLLLLLDAGVVVAGTLVVGHVFGFLGRDGGTGSDRGTGGEDWHREAVELAGEVSRTAAGFGRPADPDRVSRRLLPLSARLRGLARTAPAAVDADDHHRLYELGVACQRVGLEHRPVVGDYASLEERLESLGAEADDARQQFATTG